MTRASLRVRTLVAVAVLGTAGCGGGVSPTAPTPISSPLAISPLVTAPEPVAVIAIVDGVVTGRPSFTAVDRVPQPGVMIEVLDGEATVATTTTDENGNYHLELAPGDIRIRASKAGYQPTVIGPFAIATGSRTVRSFSIEPRYVPPSPPAPSPVTRVVRGRVTDVRGNGVASALVTVVDADTRQGFRSVSADATGAFAVSFPVSAERRATALYVTKPGYPRQEVPFECCVNPEPQFIDV